MAHGHLNLSARRAIEDSLIVGIWSSVELWWYSRGVSPSKLAV